ncbi:MAG: SDR family NAD(P)-dependent oxidoreductase [Micromonosporaceae bacterium]|jgi:NAD(P)-dependent dehydrogenase (short-subunit alcohol dehydrogenase family)|nr:SDR family NAD(P)-dependent oxidoreductase [Micromonosporaceae bacterium]
MDATVIVTGGTGGLGAAVTEAFLSDGWRVVVPWVAEAELARVTAHERLELVKADLFDPHAATGVAVAAAARPDMPLLALVNLVGGYAIGGLVHEVPVEEFERMLTLNLRPTYLMTQAVVPHLLAAGGGAVVCVGSRAAVSPFPGAAGYVTAKAAVVAFAQAVAVEYREHGVRCNAVLPSVIDTPANRLAQPDADHSRWVPPAEIAAVIRFLASPASAPTSGAAIPVYGRA